MVSLCGLNVRILLFIKVSGVNSSWTEDGM